MTTLMRPNRVRDTLRAGGTAYATMAFRERCRSGDADHGNGEAGRPDRAKSKARPICRGTADINSSRPVGGDPA